MPSIVIAPGPVCPTTLGEAGFDELTHVMYDVAMPRMDSAENHAAYAAAAAACPEPSFDLAALARYARPGVDNPLRTFRNLLGSQRFDEARVVEALFASALAGDVRMIAIECQEVRSSGVILSLQAAGPERSVALDWRRIEQDCDDFDEQLIATVGELLDEVVHAYSRGKPAPVVAVDPQIGAFPAVRREVSARIPEYALAVDRNYLEHMVVPDPYEQRHPVARLADVFSSWEEELTPRPVRLRHRPASGPPEYAVRLPQGTGFAVVRPAAPAQGLTGLRAEQRALELGNALTAVHGHSLTKALRIDRFRHQTDRAWRRHALLLSIFHATLTGALRPGGFATAA